MEIRLQFLSPKLTKHKSLETVHGLYHQRRKVITFQSKRPNLRKLDHVIFHMNMALHQFPHSIVKNWMAIRLCAQFLMEAYNMMIALEKWENFRYLNMIYNQKLVW